MITRLLAQSTVSDLARAEEWYSRLFERGPDTRPMDGLIEWHLGDTFGLQVWAEPERAGNSTVVIEYSDLEVTSARLRAVEIEHEGITPGGGARILPLSDPDGNRVVLSGR